jgi:hypothetical protein
LIFFVLLFYVLIAVLFAVLFAVLIAVLFAVLIAAGCCRFARGRYLVISKISIRQLGHVALLLSRVQHISIHR